ncbi:unnamed protein product [Darwinula stevensoni]|uniref:Nucleotide exchange factor Fes1 domain-containing protein n=1 Tax=Darwinula stevensoni TaxID=69355 RepID=A0A7R8X7H0_9CRUS|nr:unnamed protein product [Darwinula stevensoni]CAG0889143.1 unnamed protein product [Darwinula stevensoni]
MVKDKSNSCQSHQADEEGVHGAGDAAEGQVLDPRVSPNLQGLLRLAVQQTAHEDAPGPPSSQAMDPERRAWLAEVLDSVTSNIPEEMKKAIEMLSSDAISRAEEDPTVWENALDVLLSHVDNLDYARDFHKMGGFVVLHPCLMSPHAGVRTRAAELIGELAQNHPYCQSALMETHLLPSLMGMVDSDPHEEARLKALFAISMLLRAIQSPQPRLATKSSFLLSALCRQNPSIKDTLITMGFVEQLVYLIQGEHDHTHEHLMYALLELIRDHRQGITECQKPPLQLKEVLLQRIHEIHGKEEFQEEEQYAKELLSLAFPSGGGPSGDR